MKNSIKIFGAREHNLKNINLEIPKDSLVVITGPSGSGKSSLAMSTLFAEGQRRYVESLSSYARQFLGMQRKPDVDKIDGLCPAISIEQKTVGYNPRSTVGTITEIYDYFRILFARLGSVFCPDCGKKLEAQTPLSVSKSLLQKHKDEIIWIMAEIANNKKGEFKSIIKEYFAKGYSEFLIDGAFHSFNSIVKIEALRLGKTYRHSVYLILDKLVINEKNQDTLFDAAQKAFALTRKSCSVAFYDKAKSLQTKTYLAAQICLDCVVPFPELEPRLFSFNSPLGACQACEGLGTKFSWDNVWQDSDDEPGVALSECEACLGARLNKNALSVKINDKNIFQLCKLSIKKLKAFFDELSFVDNQAKIAERVLYEIKNRLVFLNNVGLDYLNLARNAATLSGGESQRIRLATQIGSSLSGVLYVLDEPSIGLHQRDNDKLIQTLKNLRDLGNTVVVVEHDLDTMAEADYLIDIGPASGIFGGQVVSVGTPEQVAKDPNSLTGQYLLGTKKINIPAKRRKATHFLTIYNATKNNLKNISVSIPLETLTVVTGVSGSGKSSLIMQSLVPALNNYFLHGYSVFPDVGSIEGIVHLKNIVFVDQKSIGKTSRSNPATYLGIFNEIRNIFSLLPESKVRGYGPGHFSFNVEGGRCDECSGDGKIKISMQLLEDVIVVCQVCDGKRYNNFVLEIKFKGKNIFDVLELSFADALEFFKEFSGIHKRIQLMCDVGLDYLTLGQASTTISGGEGQRLKLVNELAKRGSQTLYVLDEPTTGLHFADIEKLLTTLNRLVDRGNSVVVIEHNLDIIKCADYLIDIGPGGGDDGGELLFSGPCEDLLKVKNSETAKYLKKYLKP